MRKYENLSQLLILIYIFIACEDKDGIKPFVTEDLKRFRINLVRQVNTQGRLKVAQIKCYSINTPIVDFASLMRVALSFNAQGLLIK